MKWIQQTKESVDQAVKDEAEKSKRNIDHFRVVIQESEESISRLTCEVEDLEKRLQNEKRNQRKYEVVFSETSEEMKNDMHRLEAELRKQISENKEYARDSETELNKLHEKLQWLSELLPDERRSRAEVESKNKDLKIAYDEAKSRLAEDAALLKQIKLEVVSKEVSVYTSSVVANEASFRCSHSTVSTGNYPISQSRLRACSKTVTELSVLIG
jgi:chromosome segregation ATPase